MRRRKCKLQRREAAAVHESSEVVRASTRPVAACISDCVHELLGCVGCHFVMMKQSWALLGGAVGAAISVGGCVYGKKSYTTKDLVYCCGCGRTQ